MCFHFSKITRSSLNSSGICWIRHGERLLSLEAKGLSGINDVYILWISFICRSFNARHLLGVEVLLVQNEQHSPCKWEGELKGGMLCIELAYYGLATLLWKWIQIKLPLCKQARWGIFYVMNWYSKAEGVKNLLWAKAMSLELAALAELGMGNAWSPPLQCLAFLHPIHDISGMKLQFSYSEHTWKWLLHFPWVHQGSVPLHFGLIIFMFAHGLVQVWLHTLHMRTSAGQIFFKVTGKNLGFHIVLEMLESKAEAWVFFPCVAATIFVSKQQHWLNYSAPLIMCTYGSSLQFNINFYFSCGE